MSREVVSVALAHASSREALFTVETENECWSHVTIDYERTAIGQGVLVLRDKLYGVERVKYVDMSYVIAIGEEFTDDEEEGDDPFR
jgi:hypothetical protein